MTTTAPGHRRGAAGVVVLGRLSGHVETRGRRWATPPASPGRDVVCRSASFRLRVRGLTERAGPRLRAFGVGHVGRDVSDRIFFQPNHAAAAINATAIKKAHASPSRTAPTPNSAARTMRTTSSVMPCPVPNRVAAQANTPARPVLAVAPAVLRSDGSGGSPLVGDGVDETKASAATVPPWTGGWSVAALWVRPRLRDSRHALPSQVRRKPASLTLELCFSGGPISSHPQLGEALRDWQGAR